jgi:hypothetical protein
MSEPVTITTEDGVTLKEGDHAYDYYSMAPGVIGPISNFWSDPPDPWFDFIHDGTGKRVLLNGQRICSDAFAKGRKFRDA